jgi:hypothetical protein
MVTDAERRARVFRSIVAVHIDNGLGVVMAMEMVGEEGPKVRAGQGR